MLEDIVLYPFSKIMVLCVNILSLQSVAMNVYQISGACLVIYDDDTKLIFFLPVGSFHISFVISEVAKYSEKRDALYLVLHLTVIGAAQKKDIAILSDAYSLISGLFTVRNTFLINLISVEFGLEN
jgi:hypothetical protein